MTFLLMALAMLIPGAAQAQEKPIDRWADIASDQLPEGRVRVRVRVRVRGLVRVRVRGRGVVKDATSDER
jgi:hypothetical protein